MRFCERPTPSERGSSAIARGEIPRRHRGAIRRIVPGDPVSWGLPLAQRCGCRGYTRAIRYTKDPEGCAQNWVRVRLTLPLYRWHSGPRGLSATRMAPDLYDLRTLKFESPLGFRKKESPMTRTGISFHCPLTKRPVGFPTQGQNVGLGLRWEQRVGGRAPQSKRHWKESGFN